MVVCLAMDSTDVAWALIDEALHPGSRHKASIWELLGLRSNASREEVEIRDRHLRHQLHPDRLHQQGHFARYMMEKLQSDTLPLSEAMYVCV